MLVLSINPFFNKKLFESRNGLVRESLLKRSGRGNLEKSGNFKVKMKWPPCLCIIKHCIERAKNQGENLNFYRVARNIFGPRASRKVKPALYIGPITI